jgi:hypothetical protein
VSAAGIDISEQQGSAWYLFGAPPDIVERLKLEAEERDDPLLRMWCEGQQAERRTHDHYVRHKSFDDVSHEDMIRPHVLRRQATSTYAFSVTHSHALTEIAKFADGRGVVSLGAGTGWWEHRLALEAGLDVISYDLYPPGDPENHWYANTASFCEVLKGDVQTLRDHPDRVLFLSWPPYQDPFASQALREFERAGGTHVVYIGESYGGCCADDKFFKRIGETYEENGDEDGPTTKRRRGRWSASHRVGVPQWMGIHDEILCLERH